MKRYTPEQLKYELGACWIIDHIADLMAARGLENANALDVLNAPSGDHEAIVWMACRMLPGAAISFAERCIKSLPSDGGHRACLNGQHANAALANCWETLDPYEIAVHATSVATAVAWALTNAEIPANTEEVSERRLVYAQHYATLRDVFREVVLEEQG